MSGDGRGVNVMLTERTYKGGTKDGQLDRAVSVGSKMDNPVQPIKDKTRGSSMSESDVSKAI